MKRVVALALATAALALFPVGQGFAAQSPLSASPHHLSFRTPAGSLATAQEVFVSLSNSSEAPQTLGTVSTSTCSSETVCFGPFYMASNGCSGITLSSGGTTTCTIFVELDASTLSSGHYADTLSVRDVTSNTSLTVGLVARVTSP